MQNWKRLISLLLVFAMTASYLPAPAYAEDLVEEIVEEVVEEVAEEVFEEVTEEVIEEIEEIEEITEEVVEEVIEEIPEEIISVQVTDSVAASNETGFAPADGSGYGELIDPNAWGYCGSNVTNVTWGVYSGSTLVISGEGAMDDFGVYDKAGWWNEYPISHVIVEEGVTYIGNYAFNSGYSWHTPLLETVQLADSVSGIGVGAFENCTELTSINLGKVQNISVSAFEGCTALTEVDLGSLRDLASKAFKDCTGLTDLTLPGTVGCTSYAVGNESFRNCTGLTTVTVEKGVKWLGEFIFDGCTKLTTVNLPSTLLDIGKYAFDGCTKLSRVNIPDLASWCGMNLSGYFSNNSNEQANPLYYGADLYVNGELLTDQVITADMNVQNSMNNFVGCKSIQSVTFPAMEGKYINWIIHNCSGIQYIYFQGSAPKGFTTDAFAGITATAYYPASDKSWTSDKFGNYGGSITWVAVEHFHEFDESGNCSCGAVGGWCGEHVAWTFDEETGTLTISGQGPMRDFSQASDAPWYWDYKNVITSVVVEKGVTSVGDNAFGGEFNDYNKLVSVTFSDTVERIGMDAFFFDQGLTEIVLPDSVTELGGNAFASCANLVSVTLSSKLTKVTGFNSCYALKTIEIPEGVTEVGGFKSSGLTSITLPESVTTISAYAFEGCTGLTDITVPKSVTTIGNYAFGNRGTKNYIIRFEGDAPVIGNNAFQSLNVEVHYPGDKNGWSTVIRNTYGAKTIEWVEDLPDSGTCGENVTWSFDKTTGVLTISGSGPMWDFYDEFAPWTCRQEEIKAVEITEGVTSVGGSAFANGEGDYTVLTTVTLADTVTTIGSSAFYNQKNLTSMDLSHVKELGGYVFAYCSNLRSVTFSDELKKIWDNTFIYCSNLENVVLPRDLEYVGEAAFGACYKAFGDLVLPEGLKEIREEAFGACESMTSLILPNALEIISDSAFASCDSLTKITFAGPAPEYISTTAFHNVKANAYYPADDTTWTEEVRQSYGGNITWVPWGVHVHAFGSDHKCECGLYGGKCYADVNWLMDPETGVMTIFGSGNMGYYFEDNAPWAALWPKIKTVLVEPGVTTIGSYAFYECSNLAGIEISEGVEFIGENAFYGCSALKSIKLPKSAVGIGTGAFYGCSSLTEMDLPDGVTAIGRDTFRECSSLVRVDIPSGVNSIAEGAFAECSALKEITLPAGLTSIAEEAFYSCQALEALEIPARVTKIGDSAFTYCYALADINIPKGVTAIGEQAFAWCSSLTNVELPESVARIGLAAFEQCTGLTELTVPAGVSEMGTGAFFGCTALKKITFEGSAPRIEDAIFGNVTAEAYYSGNDETWTEEVRQNYGGEITWIPVVEVIASGNCGVPAESVSWTLDSAGVLTVSGTGKMAPYNAPEEAPWYSYRDQIRHVVVEDGVTWVAQYGFKGYTALETVTLGKDVEYIGLEAFYGCTTLRSLDLGGTESILNRAFRGCIALAEVVIPDSVHTIEDYAFAECSGLTTLTVGSGLKTLDNGAFYNCTALTGTLALPEGLEYIGTDVFNGCKLTGTLTIPDAVSAIGRFAFAHCDFETLDLGSGVKTVGEYAFAYTGLKEIVIPDNVTTMAKGAFAGNGEATSLHIGAGLTEIPEFAFEDCAKLTNVTIPATVETIGTQAFCGCIALEEIVFEGDAPEMASDIFAYITATAHYPGGNETWTSDKLQDYGGSITWKVIQPTSGTCGADVTWSFDDTANTLTISGEGPMADYYFYNAPWAGLSGDIYAVVIEEGVTTVGDYAFIGHKYLQSVSLPDSLTRIGNSAFEYCEVLKTGVTISPNMTEVGQRAFFRCHDLTGSLAFPGTTTTIGDQAFFECYELTGVTFSEGLITIGEDGFLKCSKLSGDLVLPDSLTTMGGEVFSYTNLSSVVVGKGLKNLPGYAFYGCSSLKSIDLGNVEKILGYALTSCGLTGKLTLPETLTYLDCVGGLDGHITELVFLSPEVPTFGTWETNLESMSDLTIVWVPGESLEKYTVKLADIFDDDVQIRAIGSEAPVATGACGYDAKWELTKDGTLRIYGTGEMWSNNEPEYALWYDYRDQITAVIVEDGVTTVGQYAFQGYTELTSVTLGKGVKTIYYSAFAGCTKLTEVDLGGTGEIINYAFAGCTALTELAFPDGVQTIWGNVVEGCTSLTTVTFGSGLKEINESAFENCSSLTGTLVLPEGLETIGSRAFYGCSGLTGTLTIPDSLTSLGEWAFSECSGLEGLELGSGLTAIEAYTFYNCPGLKQIVIPDNVTSLGESVFSCCKGAASVTIGAGLTEIPNGTFANCTGLTGTLTIPDTVTLIGENAFTGAEKITGLKLSSNLKTIGDYAFCDLKGLKTVPDLPDTLETISQGAFERCEKMYGILTIPDSVRSIGNSAFNQCREIRQLKLGRGLEELEAYAFFACEQMRGYITLPEAITVIPMYAFGHCKRLQSITVMGDITEIGACAFMECGVLNFTMELKDGLTSIGAYAFYNCSKLTGELVIPDTVSEIGSEAFYRCTGLTALNLGGENSRLKTIGEWAFHGCSGVTGELVIPDSVQFIHENAFSAMYGLTGLKLGKGLKEIRTYAFENCYGLTGTLTIPECVNVLEKGAFRSTGYDRVIITAEDLWELGTTGYDGSGNNVFAECGALKEIDFTAEYPLFDVYGDFKGLENLAIIRAPWENFDDYVDVLEDQVKEGVEFKYLNFGNCGDNVTWYFDESTGELAISGQGAMWNYESGKTPWYCFRDKIIAVDVEETVTGIGKNAFADTGLVSVVLPDSITGIGESAFYNCRYLNSVTLPGSLVAIPGAMFSRCGALTSVTVPAAVTHIGGSAFLGSGLKEITFLGAAPQFGNEAVFEGCTVTAIYTAGESWTDDVMKHYGGTVTWQAMETDWEIDENAGQLQGIEAGMAWQNLEQQLQAQGYEKPAYQPREGKKSDGLATGETITIGDMTLTIVVIGDVDGDAVVGMEDVQSLIDHVTKGGDKRLTEIYLEAGCAYEHRGDGDDISIFDIYALLDSMKTRN